MFRVLSQELQTSYTTVLDCDRAFPPHPGRRSRLQCHEEPVQIPKWRCCVFVPPRHALPRYTRHWLVVTTYPPANKLLPDANDESLQRYKESLGLGGGKDLSDPNDPRTCIIKSLSLESPGRPPITVDLSEPGSEATLKDKPFTIKEGAKFTMAVTFKVQHEIISGLSYVQVVKRKGIRVSKDSEMLGSYGPNTDKQPIYTKRCKFPVRARPLHGPAGCSQC